MPLALYAARALPSLKRGYSLIRSWHSLPPSERAALQEQGERTVAAIMAVKVAATAERSAADPPATWSDAVKAALQGGATERMAKTIVAYLQRASEATADEIAAAVGAAGRDDSTFKTALDLARKDGYIRRAGVTFRGIRWDTTEWADLHLLDSPHVLRIEEGIVALLDEVGIASLDHLSAELGLENDAPELLAALERAVADESVVWYCNGIYGLPADRLENFEPQRDLWAETLPGATQKDLGSALAELESAVKGLGAAMKRGDSREGEIEGADGHDDPYDGIRRIQELHDEGMLTTEELAAKKAEILRRI